MIEVEKLKVGYGAKDVLSEFSVSFNKGEFCGILGPNGSGKSTLLKSLIGFLPKKEGSITVEKRELFEISKLELARKIALIPQDFQLQFDYRVEDLVLMGRFPYLGYWQNYSKEDRRIVEEVLVKLELMDKKDKLFSQLSGGEKQRVSIARVLAQDAEAILMDESFANLDINHQIEIMQLLSDINKNDGKLIIIISHNINLTSEYCSRILMLQNGRLISDGSPEDVINQENLELLYDTPLQVIKNPRTGKPNLIYPGKK